MRGTGCNKEEGGGGGGGLKIWVKYSQQIFVFPLAMSWVTFNEALEMFMVFVL